MKDVPKKVHRHNLGSWVRLPSKPAGDNYNSSACGATKGITRNSLESFIGFRDVRAGRLDIRNMESAQRGYLRTATGIVRVVVKEDTGEQNYA